MRNSRPLISRCRDVFAAEMALTEATQLRYFSGRTPVYIAINLQSVLWGRRPVFRSEWVAHFERGYRIIYPLSAHEIPNVADERLFSLLNDCDAQSGLFIKGAKSIHQQDKDIDGLVKQIQMAYRASTITAVNLLRRVLRVHTPVARSLLERAPAARELVEAALPHFRAQALAAGDWLARKGGKLDMAMHGNTILEQLK